MKTSILRAIALAACAACLSAAASEIVPPQPVAFEAVNLRMTVDSCTFVPGTVRVSAVANTLRITQQMNQCLQPGPIRVVDVQLGKLAVGQYQVEVYATPQPTGTPVERLSFEVRERVEIAVFPPPPRPLTDYTGIWWNPNESGWGFSLHQSATHVMFGALYVYNASGEPEWFTMPHGQWIDSTTWTSQIYRTTGPFVALPDFDPRLVLIRPVGSATIDFSQRPGEEGRARLTYTLNGTSITKVITRMVF